MDEFEVTMKQAEETIARTADILRDLEASGAKLDGLAGRAEVELKRFSELANRDGLDAATSFDLLGLGAEMVSEWFEVEIDLLVAYAEFGEGLETADGEAAETPAKRKKSRPGGNRMKV